MTLVIKKKCSKCGHEKEIERFGFCVGALDGRKSYCRLCENNRVKEKKKEKQERNNQYKVQ